MAPYSTRPMAKITAISPATRPAASRSWRCRRSSSAWGNGVGTGTWSLCISVESFVEVSPSGPVLGLHDHGAGRARFDGFEVRARYLDAAGVHRTEDRITIKPRRRQGRMHTHVETMVALRAVDCGGVVSHGC